NADGSFGYTPAQDFTGADSFSYRATDGQSTSAVTVVTITVNGLANTPPVAQPDVYFAFPNAQFNVSAIEGILANDFDPDGDLLTILLVGSVTNGSLSLNAPGDFTYNPAVD